MKKSWKLILIALLAALLVCTCMSAIADETDPGHGVHGEDDPAVGPHDITVGWRNPQPVKHHDTCLSSQVNGQWGGIGIFTYEAYCTTCGYSLGYYEDREEFDPCFSSDCVVVDPTCEEDGSMTFTCDYCGKTWSETLDAPGHIPDETDWHTIIPPKCNALGWEETVCAVCGKIVGRNIDMLPHQLGGKKIKDATCTEPEIWQQGCLGCDYVTGPTWKVGSPLGHIAVEHAMVPAHCETDGMKAYTDCSRCGAVIAGAKEAIPKLGHIYNGEKICVQEPTCQQDGLYVYECSRGAALCNEHYGWYGQLVNEGKVGHLHPETGWEIDLDPDCMHVGYRVNRCVWCHGDPIKEELPIVEHKFTTWVKDQKDATCTTDGYKVLYCDYNCGTTTTVTIPATGHKAEQYWRYNRLHPDCENSMKAWVQCAVCGVHLKDVEYPAVGHNWQKDTGKDSNLEPTCTEPGIYNYHCENHGSPFDLVFPDPITGYPIRYTYFDPWFCDAHKTEVVPALGHDYKVEITPATCDKAGKEVKTCTRCGDVVTTEIPALGHDYKTELVPATCTKAGAETVACTRCGDVKSSKTIDALGHKAGEPVVTAATCTKAGSKVTKCSVCGETLKTEEIAALGHKEVVTETAATCTKAGSKVTKCSVCGETLKTEEIPALGHKEVVTETAATCTKAGSKVTKCSVCGETLKTEEIAALGHKAGEPVVTAATCTVAGSEVTKCTVCGEVIETKEIPAPGHVPGKEKIEQNMGNTYCTVCGELLSSRKIPSSSGNSGSTGSSTPAASAPTIYSGVINAAGIAASELGGNGASLVTPIDLSADGVYTYSLVAGDKYVVGTMIVTVSGGKATVSYSVKNGVTISGESLYIFANGEALKAGTATPASFNAAIDAAGDTKIILAVNLIGSFDVSIADAYVADAAQIAAMKAIVD